MRSIPAIVFFAAFLVLWEAAAIVLAVPSLILPLPSRVLEVSVTDFGLYLKHSVPTLVEVLLGYAVALVLGAGSGLIIAFSRVLGDAVYPAMVAAQIMPKVAIAPLLVVWFGFGIEPKLIMTALIAFFPIVINTIVALNMTTRESIYLFRSMGASSAQTFFKLRLPTALPVFFGGLKIAATLAVIGVVVAEFYSSDQGLGYLLLLQVSNSDTTGAFGSILYLTAMGLLVFGAIVVIERLMVPAHMLKKFDELTGGSRRQS
jgi:NitT/TauT family transport system permease protein